MNPIFANAKQASRKLALLDDQTNKHVLQAFAENLRLRQGELIAANLKDLSAVPSENPNHDRLLLTAERIESMAAAVEAIASMHSPCGIILDESIRPTGLAIQQITVPLGVVGMIYESRPNVTADAFALCFRSSNACILKGGSEAQNSNAFIVQLIQNALEKFGVEPSVITLLPADRAAGAELLKARGYVDVLIPRGSQQLIDYVRQNAEVPVIETGAGVVHVYFDQYGDLEKGRAIIDNAKSRRVSVCNALDTLLVHESRQDELPQLIEPLRQKGLLISEEYGKEFLSLQLSVKIVASIEEALEHIEQYGSKHSEAIVTEDPRNAEIFLKRVDAAAVYVNASTAFTDGGEFGLGAEIGISTQKLHARGPFALKALTSYKWLIRGSGQVR
ncbi:MAG: glutamate-5-semialdehyde dehydrogenase [Myxococcota bacterium]